MEKARSSGGWLASFSATPATSGLWYAWNWQWQLLEKFALASETAVKFPMMQGKTQVSSDQSQVWLFYIGDSTTQLYRIVNSMDTY